MAVYDPCGKPAGVQTSRPYPPPDKTISGQEMVLSNDGIDPEQVIAWLITQPNANGTLYLERVARCYMSALRTAPAKFAIPAGKETGSIFACRTPDDLDAVWEIFKAAPNYKEVNQRSSGMFSAAMKCYRRYLQYRAETAHKEEADRRPELEVVGKADEPPGIRTIRRVDFRRPELCAHTKPLSCTIGGQTVTSGISSWSQLLVSITEWLIAGGNPTLEALNQKPLCGRSAFFLSRKPTCGACAHLSNGKWISTNYSAKTMVTVIKHLCQHCGVDLEEVTISCQTKAEDEASRIRPQSVFPVSLPQTPALDPAVSAKLSEVLSTHFANGYRLNSPIEMVRLRSFAAKDLGRELTLSDEELKTYIAACGVHYQDKIYIVSEATKERIKGLAEDYFAGGAKVIFFAAFFERNESWLFEANVVTQDMLAGIFRGLFGRLSFTRTYFGYTDAPIPAVLESEILRVWGSGVLQTCSQLAQRLPYIPLERIRSALGQNGDFIRSGAGTFAHISRIVIMDQERQSVREAAAQGCSAHGYISMAGLPLDEIAGRNDQLSAVAIRSAVYRLCLSDEFDKKGEIVTRKGDILDARTILEDYCRTIDACSLKDLLRVEQELTGDVHRAAALEAANAVLVRIDMDTYVADKYVHFDTDLIDKAIELVVKGAYLPLKSFTAFGIFPDCGQAWNPFLLESYCRRFSRKFRFDSLSGNSRGAGTVVRKNCAMDYTEILADAVARADIPLNRADVGRFLLENGYVGRCTKTKSAEIVSRAKALRERRG